jgi:hypothetical protein
MNTWKRTPATTADTTRYASSTGYTVVGRNIRNSRGRTVRVFDTFNADNNALPTGGFATLKAAKAYADQQADNAAARTTPAAPKVATPGLTVITHPDGTISTRKSKTMAYTHAVEIGPAPADRYAADLIRKAEKLEAKAARFREAIVFNEVRIGSRGFTTHNDYLSHQATLTGTDREVYTWCNKNAKRQDYSTGEVTGVRAYLLRIAEESAVGYDEQAAKLRAEAADILAKGEPVGEFYIYRWSTRRDLAESCANGKDGSWYAAQGHSVRVVAIDAN